jgi:hypothetical protein
MEQEPSSRWIYVPELDAVVPSTHWFNMPENNNRKKDMYQTPLFKAIANKRYWGFIVRGYKGPTATQCRSFINEKLTWSDLIAAGDIALRDLSGFQDLYLYYKEVSISGSS